MRDLVLRITDRNCDTGMSLASGGDNCDTAPMRITEFIIAATIAEITPGPNMGYLAALAIAQGRRAGLAAVAGVTLGLALLGVAAAFGAGLVTQTYPALGEALRWAGVAYLLWLAFEAWRGEEEGPDGAFAPSFRRGLVVNLLNPKAGLFYVAVLPAFLNRGDTGIGPLLTLTAIYVAIATAVHAGVVIGAAGLRASFADAASLTRIRRIAAVLLAVVALWLAWETVA
jgi:threonine/homoserine/homoserine lactone efflux protein